MDGERIDPSELPRSVHARPNALSPETLSDIVEALQSGAAWKCEKTFQTNSTARGVALQVRKQLMDVDFGNGLRPSTKVWQNDGQWQFAIVMR